MTAPSLFAHRLDWAPDSAFDARALPSHPGVALITDRDDRPILLVLGENLRRVVAGRLAAPPPDSKTRKANLSAVAARVYWHPTYSRFETELVHARIARRLNPKGYRREIAFKPVWFLKIDRQAATPRIGPVCDVGPDDASCVGPFATRKHADEWAQVLTETFSLCRYSHVLEQAPHGQPCAYAEMEMCPAPCDGRVPLDAYRAMLADAFAFSAGDHEPALAALREAMQSAAQSLRFEKAAALRRVLDRATAAIGRPEFRHVASLAACRWLVIQRAGPKRRKPAASRVKPFFIRCGDLEEGEPTALSDLDRTVPAWLADCAADRPSAHASSEPPSPRSETLWLLGKFLFQGDRACGLFYRFDRLPAPTALSDAVRARFGP